jgi:hypothetical protein
MLAGILRRVNRKRPPPSAGDDSKWGIKEKWSAVRSPEAGDIRKPGSKMPSGIKPREADGFIFKP